MFQLTVIQQREDMISNKPTVVSALMACVCIMHIRYSDAVDCSAVPPAATNGGVTGTTFVAGDTVTYTCDATYQVTPGSPTTATCQSGDGTWDNAAPTCLKDCSSAPSAATNGGVTGSVFLEGNSVTYTCDSGYQVTSGGTTTATCQSDGTWDNAAPACLKDCGSAPAADTNGGVTGSAFLEGNSVTYTCDSGYQVTSGGTTTATCQSDGTWDNAAPTCITDCTAVPSALTDGTVAGTSHLEGDTVTYSSSTTTSAPTTTVGSTGTSERSVTFVLLVSSICSILTVVLHA